MAVSGRPLLVTERLELWIPTRDDVWAMHAIVSEPSTRRYLAPSESRVDHFERFCRNAGSWLLYGHGSFMLRTRDSGELVGNAGVFHSFRGLGADFEDSPEAGWILKAGHVGKGLAHEAMTAVLGWFEREHGRQRIVCMITPGNTRSTGLAERLGFEAMREALLPSGDAVQLFERPAPKD